MNEAKKLAKPFGLGRGFGAPPFFPSFFFLLKNSFFSFPGFLLVLSRSYLYQPARNPLVELGELCNDMYWVWESPPK